MMTSLLDAVGEWIGGWLQRFGVKRGIVALLLGLAAVSVIVAGVGLYGLVRSVLAVAP